MTNITGRDSHIMTRALAYAAAVIPLLPELYREESDREDMLRLLRALAPSEGQFELDRAAETLQHLEAIAA